MKRKTFVILTTPLVGAALMLSAVPANAAVNDHSNASPAHSAAQPSSPPGYVIADTAHAVNVDGGAAAGGATFYPTGPVNDSTLVIIPNPDGSLPNRLTQAKLTALATQAKSDPTAAQSLGFTVASAGSQTTASPVAENKEVVSPDSASYNHAYSATSGSWSGQYNGGSVIGVSDTATVTYSWDTPPGFAQTNAGRGLGYYRGYNGGDFGVWSNWYNLGTASDGDDGEASVPWGSVAANSAFMATCTSSEICWGYWSP
jgi:hypothetical protein